ncbi:hypothetical protein evm_000212 [Chilo suppressalis]|nr:hypothetical protein evm_000212 [Chilo suppressalis]
MASGVTQENAGSMQRRCINCCISVPRRQPVHSLDMLSNSMLNVLSSWIAPDSIYYTTEEVPAPQYGHQQVCFGCGKSILRSRSYRVSLHCPERNIILRWTPAHQVSRISRVCAACWRAANREVQRQQLYDANRSSIEQMDVEPTESVPVIPVPPPFPAGLLPVQPSRPVIPKIQSSVYKRAVATSLSCLFSGCWEQQCLLVPRVIREMLLIHNKFYVPTCCRICQHHLNNGRWSDLTSNLQDFTGVQFDAILNIMQRAVSHCFDFENISAMAPFLCHYWLGMNAEQFDELLACVPSLLQSVKNPRLALCIYIVKLRTGDSNERLSSLFQMSRRTLERKMNIARSCLVEDFVSRHLGFGHVNVEQVASRNKIIPEGLFGNPILPNDIKPAIVMCDATYIFVQSSSNYRFQKESYMLLLQLYCRQKDSRMLRTRNDGSLVP